MLDIVYEKVRSHLLEDEMVVDGRVPDVGERRKVPLARRTARSYTVAAAT